MSFTEYYSRLIDSQQLQYDPEQEQLAVLLSQIEKTATSNYFSKLFTEPLKGLYVYGDVGCGKTTIINIYYRYSKVKLKIRVHFHKFMSNIHNDLKELRTKSPDKTSLIRKYAKFINKKYLIIFLDEFFIDDITDAMLAKNLFSELFNLGTRIVTTSNCKPENLYKDGLQRELFLAFIPILKKHTTIYHMLSKTDYRQNNNAFIKYLYPINRENYNQIESEWQRLTNKDSITSKTIHLSDTRNKIFQCTCNRMLKTNFTELCKDKLSNSDYIKIIAHFDIIIVIDIPQIDHSNNNLVKKFVYLIDILYEHNKKIIFNSEVAISDLYSGPLLIFNRTKSRLVEMSSTQYWNK